METRRAAVASVHGVVAAAHPLAAAIGARMLAGGGNAFDAACATSFALTVAEPFMSGIAGMGVATCYVAAERQVRALDYVTSVPRSFDGSLVQRREQLRRGPLGVGTPGNLAGWCELLAAYGTRSLADVLQPAIRLARDGVPLAAFGAAEFQVAAELSALPYAAELERVYLGGQSAVQPGYLLRQPDLALTFKALAAEGPALLYGGSLGRAITELLGRLGGFVSLADLECVKPQWREPLTSTYRGVTLGVPPPPYEAFQYLLTLRILEAVDFKALERNGPAHVDNVVRAARLAAGERIANNNPDAETLSYLLSDSNVTRLRHRLWDGVWITGPTDQWTPTAIRDASTDHTTSLSIADRDGNVVCMTQSLGSVFGSGIVVPGTGVCLNNFLHWGELDQNGPNALKPRAPLALPMAPTIVTADGRPVLAIGTPGGYGICQTLPQVLVQYFDYGLDLQSAIEAPRARLWDGAGLLCEDRLPETTIATLRRLGHDVEVGPRWTMDVGGMHAIGVDHAVLTGAADPRRDGGVVAA